MMMKTDVPQLTGFHLTDLYLHAALPLRADAGFNLIIKACNF